MYVLSLHTVFKIINSYSQLSNCLPFRVLFTGVTSVYKPNFTGGLFSALSVFILCMRTYFTSGFALKRNFSLKN